MYGVLLSGQLHVEIRAANFAGIADDLNRLVVDALTTVEIELPVMPGAFNDRSGATNRGSRLAEKNAAAGEIAVCMRAGVIGHDKAVRRFGADAENGELATTNDNKRAVGEWMKCAERRHANPYVRGIGG